MSRRRERSEDEPFLRRLVTETVAAQLGAELWPEAIRDRLLDAQYALRRESIGARFPHATSEIILLGGECAGWIVTAESPGEIRLIEIMVLAGYRGNGIGSTLIRELCSAKTVRLSVAIDNVGAIRLYQRLGFQRVGGDEVRHEMESAALRRQPA